MWALFVDKIIAQGFYNVVPRILENEKKFCLILVIYGVVISVFTLAIPISVQALVGSVTNTLLLRPVLILTSILLGLLLFSVVLNAIQIYVMEMMERHIYSYVTKEMALRLLYAESNVIDNINRTTLANKYFEIMNLQKALPNILVRGFALLLQTTVGLILVSFYHYFLFALNIIIFLMLYLVWAVWKNKAFSHAVKVSSAKYETARLLAEIARSNSLFRSNKLIDFACNQVNDATYDYVKIRKKYFRSYFAQHIGFLAIYAFGSTALLGVGGWLVIKEQLTIGQLVAAELIMSSIFYGVTKFAYHLSDLYQLYSSCVKINDFYDLPLQKQTGNLKLPKNQPCALKMQEVITQQREENIFFNMEIRAGEKIMAHVANQPIETAFVKLIKKQTKYSGKIYFNDVNLFDLDAQYLQDSVIIIDNHYIIEVSIKNWLLLAKPSATHDEMLQVLELVELYDVVSGFPDGINTMIKPYGYPLHFSEMMKLKLAAAILSEPAMLIINGVFDSLNHAQRERIIMRILELPPTFIYFTNARTIAGFDNYLLLNNKKHISFDNPQDYEVSFE